VSGGETLNMQNESRFAICLTNEGYPVSLDLLKVYQVIDDDDAEQDGMIRVVDESGEDYLYDATRFLVVTLPSVDASRLLNALEAPAATSH
jgi:hypothetical protein